MAIELLHNRGDIALGNQSNPKDGQIFISYENTDYSSSKGHSYSKGQLWAKMPNSESFTELANARSLDSLNYKGRITESFQGDFINANEVTQADFRHCHVGDFWIMGYRDEEHFKIPLYKGDILLITSTTYEENPIKNTGFRETLKDVDYIRIPLSNVDKLINLVDTDTDLGMSLRYGGEFSSLEEFYSLLQKNGNLYICTSPLSIVKQRFDVGSVRNLDGDYVKLKVGDMIWWNSKTWVVIPSGQDAETILYTPNSKEIDAVTTFEDWQKTLLKSSTTVKEALDILNKSKAQLDENGKVPYAQLPDALKNSLSLQGKFYPVSNKEASVDPNLPENQNEWPTTEPETEMQTGFYWIVDCEGRKNVQYKDKTKEGRILELNTNDWVVWVAATQQFEVIDNSDRLTSFNVIDSETEVKTSLQGDVVFRTENKIGLHVEGINTIVLGENVATVEEPDTKNRLPMFTGENNGLKNSELFQDVDKFISYLGFQVGLVNDTQDLDVYGNFGVHKTAGATATSYVNNFLYIDSASLLKADNTIFTRITRIFASDRNNYATDDETIDIDLPEASSYLIAAFEKDELTPTYHTMTYDDGFITDSLTSEVLLSHEDLLENSQEGYENIGIGRIVSEDTDTGEITFYSKTKDGKDNGFHIGYHSYNGENSLQAAKIEHFLDRDAKIRTHLTINPTVLEDEIETFVKMPTCSGTILTWEELYQIFGSSNGTPLMIPAWETMNFRERTFIGLDTSPITMRFNRAAHDNVSVERINDLSKYYGIGEKSTYSYIDSSKEGSLQDEKRGSLDDIVSFDAWLEAQRSIATKEAFIIPSTSTKDGNSNLSDTMLYTDDNNLEVSYANGYGKYTSGGKYQRILPSRTLYKDEVTYYDAYTGKLIPQNTASKDVEMPAVGGVLLTSRSRIDGGHWL